MIQELIEMIIKIRDKFTDDSDLVWTSYETAKEIREELDIYIDQLSQGDMTCLDNLNMHFAPTSTFQEHSIQNNWSNEYIEISKRFDIIYARLKGG